MDWFVWRLVGRKELGSPQPWQVQEHWSFEDVLDGHIRLDICEELEALQEAHQAAEAAARPRKGR